MKKLVNILKKYYLSFINNENNLRVKLNISFFLTAILLYSMLFLRGINNKNIYANTIEVISAVYFSLWLVTVKNLDATYNVILELVYVFIFLCCLVFSLNFWYMTTSVNFVSSFKIFLPLALVASITTLWCMYFITSRFLIITSTIRLMFRSFKSKLYDNGKERKENPSLLIVAIENITAFFCCTGRFSSFNSDNYRRSY